MAARPKVTIETLSKLGAKRLAEILVEESARSRQLKQAVQIALAAKSGPLELAHQIRKRLATLSRSNSFVPSDKAKDFRAELEQLKRSIVAGIGAKDPKIAAELLWQFLDLHATIIERLDDSSGRIGELLRSATQDLGQLYKRAKLKPSELAGLALSRITNNGYGIYDDLVFALSDALGPEGRCTLRAMLLAQRREHLASAKRAAIPPGHFDYTLSGFLRALRDLADCDNDADAFVQTYEGADLTNPAYATEIAHRLLRVGRMQEALAYLDRGAPSNKNREFKEIEWSDTRIAVLEALGRKSEAQGLRLALFDRHLTGC